MFDYETCRFCKYYDKGICIKLSEDVDSGEMAVYQFIENGHLSEAIGEAFGSEEINPELVEKISDSIETTLLNKLNFEPNIHVEDDFKCKFFW